MNENNFYIDVNGTNIKATIITNFEIYGNNYCVYTLDSNIPKNKNVYCAKISDGKLVPIEDEEEKIRTDKIVLKLINAVNA